MVQSFSNLETEFITKLREGHNTLEAMEANSSLSVGSIKNVIDQLVGKNMIEFDKKTKTYSFTKKIDLNKMLILDGNILLPVTIIKKDDKTFINRGNWYQFDGDIDIRNVVWNVELPTANNSNIDLFELVKNSALKVKKSKIQKGEYHDSLANRIVPWSKDVTFKVLTCGDEETEVSVLFNFFLGEDGLFWRDMSVRTVISTAELIEQLSCSADDRDFSKINVNRIYNVSDFIFAGNVFPISVSNTQIKYLELTGIRGKIELTEFITNGVRPVKTGEVHLFEDISEGLEYIREVLETHVSPIINKLDFTFDLENEN